MTNLAASRVFYVDTLGQQVTIEESQYIYLRAIEDRSHHCIVWVQGDQTEVGALAFKLFDDPDRDKAAALSASRAWAVDWGDHPHVDHGLPATPNPAGRSRSARLA